VGQCVAICCSVLQCVAVCCSVLQCVAVCCSVLPPVAVCCSVPLAHTAPSPFPSHALPHEWRAHRSVLQCVAVSCSVFQCVAVCLLLIPIPLSSLFTPSFYNREPIADLVSLVQHFRAADPEMLTQVILQHTANHRNTLQHTTSARWIPRCLSK